MVLNLRSWADSSEQISNDAAWRFAGTSRSATGEMHSMTDFVGSRNRGNGPPGIDVSVHIESPGYGTRSHYRSRGSRDRSNSRILSAHHIVVETETVVMAEDEDEAFDMQKKPEDTKGDLSTPEDYPRSVWFAQPDQKPRNPRNLGSGDSPGP